MIIQHELQPWILLRQQNGQLQPALWKVDNGLTPALVLFSTEARARQYAQACLSGNWQASQPDQFSLIELLIACFKQGLRLAVLDPDQATCQRAFELREVLKAARESLAAAPPSSSRWSGDPSS